MKLLSRSLDVSSDLRLGELVIGALIPIPFAVDGVKLEPGFVGGLPLVIALGADDPLHLEILAHFDRPGVRLGHQNILAGNDGAQYYEVEKAGYH